MFQEQAAGRLDAQCKRQKAVLSEMEKSEEELKTERRRLQKDLRDAVNYILFLNREPFILWISHKYFKRYLFYEFFCC